MLRRHKFKPSSNIDQHVIDEENNYHAEKLTNIRHCCSHPQIICWSIMSTPVYKKLFSISCIIFMVLYCFLSDFIKQQQHKVHEETMDDIFKEAGVVVVQKDNYEIQKNRWIVHQNFSDFARLTMDFNRVPEEDTKQVSSSSSNSTTTTTTSDVMVGVVVRTGQHKARVVIRHQPEGNQTSLCEFPRFSIRLIGDAIVAIELFQRHPIEDNNNNNNNNNNNDNNRKNKDMNKSVWEGAFTIPLQGRYQVDARFYGCSKNISTFIPQSMEQAYTSVKDPWTFQVQGPSVISTERPPLKAYLFANASWLSTTRHLMKPGDNRENNNNEEANSVLPEYMWLDPQAKTGKLLRLNHEKFQTTISQNATFTKENGMYKFTEVGNYELVCFWGSPTMFDIRERFMYIRGMIAGYQRPFKFHYYNVTNLVNPDRDWTQQQKEYCRKCKHIFLSVDELDPILSQTEFLKQMETFVGHLQKLMNDETFPIWILSNNEPPVMVSNCHSSTLPRSTNHPCNDALRHLFRKDIFQKRVHFMDNTDIALPQFGQNRDDVLANIALRIFVAVGKGVSDWRAMGQQGLIDGLHRNGTVEPNFKLIPYDWNPGNLRH